MHLRTSRWFLTAVSIAVAILTPARADYLSPTSSGECNMDAPGNPLGNRLEMLKQQSRSCEGQGTGWVHIPACGYPYPPNCARIEAAVCELQERMRNERALCMSRWEMYQNQQAALELQRKEQERAAAEEAREMNRQALANAYASGAIPPDLQHVRYVARLPRVAGRYIGRQLGLPAPPPGSSYRLSQRLTRHGMRVLQGYQAEALARFESATSDAGMNGGRQPPFRSSASLGRTLGAIPSATVQNRVPDIVAGPYAMMINGLIEARGNGVIDTPVAAIGIGMATLVAAHAAVAEAGAQRLRQPNGSAIRPEELRERRLVAYRSTYRAIDNQLAEDERQRHAELERQRAEAQRQAEAQQELERREEEARRRLAAAREEKQKQELRAEAARLRAEARRIIAAAERREADRQEQERRKADERRRLQIEQFNSVMNALGEVLTGMSNAGRTGGASSRSGECRSGRIGLVC